MIGAEKQAATRVIEQINNASEQQVRQASNKALAALSESFEDDFFSDFWLHKHTYTCFAYDNLLVDMDPQNPQTSN